MNRIVLSIIIPAFNEARGLIPTLEHLRMAQHHLHEQHGFHSEIIVVDNASIDETAEIARQQGTIVTYDPVRSIAWARNTGARAAQGDVLVFVDADTIVPEEILACIWQALESPACLGGVVKPEYTPTKQFMRL